MRKLVSSSVNLTPVFWLDYDFCDGGIDRCCLGVGLGAERLEGGRERGIGMREG